MPIRIIRKIAARIFGSKPQAQPVRKPEAAHPRRQERQEPRGPRPAGERTRERRPETRRDGPTRRQERGPASGQPEQARRDERPARGGDRRDERPARGGDRRDGRPSGRLQERRERPGGGPGGRPEQGHTPRSETRPGGAVASEEIGRRQAAHAAWDPDAFQVPAVEGKKRFHDFDLPPEIMHAVAEAGFQYCTPIQALSLAHALAGQNVAGRAQTGTGKTAAFLIAILTRYLRQPAGRTSKPGAPRALVIAPTRELVIQISRDADTLGKYCGLRYLAVYGGMDYDRQRREVEAGPIDLLVATPGRLLDYARGHVIDLSQVDTLVIDEADRMLDMGFIPDVRRIVRLLPRAEKRCTMLYSATLDDEVMRLASQWMTAPVKVEIEPEHVATDTITQQVYVVAARDKFNLLHNLLQRHADRRVLVFCNRRDGTERLAEKLRRHGIACEMLSGDVQQNRRLRALDDFRSGKVRVVVATDVAGRGIHVEDIGFVVNFDFPYEPEDYVHRIGRTGRAGHTGTAISFADENESFIIPEIEKFLGAPLACTQPEDDLLKPPAERPRHADHGHEHHAPSSLHPPPSTPRPAPASEPTSAPHAGHAPEWPEHVPAHPPAERPPRTPEPQHPRAEHRRPDVAPKPPPTPTMPSTKRTSEEWAPGQSRKG